MSKLGRLVVMCAGSALLFTATATITTATAQAAEPAKPSFCSTKREGRGQAWSFCAGGKGSHRITVSCTNPKNDHWSTSGPWMPAGKRSTATCYQITGMKLELRD